MLTASSRTSTIQRPALASDELTHMSVALANQVRLMQSMKSVYQADQQVKLLNLQADVENLLQELQNIKQQQVTSENQEVAN